MLARRHLVVRRLHLEPHLDQLLDDDPADLLALVHRAEVEVAAEVVRAGGGRAVGRLLEQEELRLASRHHREAELPGPGDLALERVAGTAGERLLVRGVDVADAAGPPGRPRRRTGRIRNVARSGLSSMSDSSIRTNPSIEDPSNMISPSSAFSNWLRRHLDVLVDAEDVGELQPEEVDAEALGQLEDVILAGPAQVGRKVFQARPVTAARSSQSHGPSLSAGQARLSSSSQSSAALNSLNRLTISVSDHSEKIHPVLRWTPDWSTK